MPQGKRQVFVSERAVHKSRAIEEFINGGLSRKEAALALDLSERQITRLAKRLAMGGVVALEHGNSGRESPKKTPKEIQERVQFLAKEKVPEF
jgi:transposase